nr:zinc knuckle CX2CX4HX4C [Tanacetum cinerariifolium]
MDTRLLKEELTRIPLWVKLHDVPIQVFEEDGISLIATFIGKHVMLDSYTSSMCNDSWGRSSFARCLIEVNSDADLVDVVSPPIVTTSNVLLLLLRRLMMVSKRDFDFRCGVIPYEMVVVGKCGKGSRVYWWRRVEKMVVGRRRYDGVTVVEEIE